MNTKGVFSHETDNWRTPKRLFDLFMKKGFRDCFPFLSEEDEFQKNYFGEKLFINPPYSKMGGVIEWIISQAANNTIFLLIPARTDTRYFRKLIDELGHKLTIFFLQGRLKFNDSKNSAPFPSMIIAISDNIIYPQTFSVFTEEEFIKELETYF